ncbi:MAG: SCO family protein [Mesorhizobium sp.]|jgi:protein SCO1/2|nr:SCO family protein [Mesorhizobium sp.]MBL8577218.1 SCO family protein [Mesorhizobium sp.]
MNGLKAFRLAAWIAVAIVSVGLAAMILLKSENPGAPAPSVSGTPAVGGPFSLVSQRGEVVSDQSLRGKPYLAFFGFTNCPDICPTTLFELSEMMAELGADADKFNVLLISVDPERDSQELLAQYMTAFDPRIVALRGTREQTDAVLKSFAAAAIKVPMEGGNYTMEHTAGVYLMDAAGKYVDLMRMEEPREERMRKLREITS